MSDEAAWGDEIVYLAEMFHDIYEVEAQRFGWQSQTPVPFSELPEANKQTMLCTVERVRGQMIADRDADKDAEIESLRAEITSLRAQLEGAQYKIAIVETDNEFLESSGSGVRELEWRDHRQDQWQDGTHGWGYIDSPQTKFYVWVDRDGSIQLDRSTCEDQCEPIAVCESIDAAKSLASRLSAILDSVAPQ